MKVRITETLTRIVEVDAKNLAEANRKVMDAYKNSEIVLTADDLDDVSVCVPADEQGICPVCGHEVSYDYSGTQSDDTGETVPWTCPACGASGKEGHDLVFDGHHYDVRDKFGRDIPGRDGY